MDISSPGSRAVLSSLERPARAVVIGASGGIGGAVTSLLAQGGFEVVHAFSRSGADPAVQNVQAGRIDLEDEASIAAAAASLARDAVPIRFILVATGLLHDGDFQPEKTYRSLEPDDLTRSFRVNAIGPALVAKHMLPLLPRTGKSIFAAISARVGSISDNRLGGWYGYRASKAALNQIMRSLSIELHRQRHDAVCFSYHPGTVETELRRPFRSGVTEGKLFAAAHAAERLLEVADGLTSSETGAFLAWDGQQIPY